MNHLKTTSALKAETRKLLMGKYRQFILVWLIAELLVGIPTMNISVLSNASLSVRIISVILFILSEFFNAIFMTGINYYSLNVGLNRPYHVRDLFYGFFYRTNCILAVKGILLLINIVCMLPAALLALLFYKGMAAPPAIAPVIIALALAAGGYFMVYFFLRYRFVLFILLDYKDASVKNIFRFSGELMKGSYFRLFYLYVTFIPYYLLCFFSLGIGFLFVMPYQQMTVTKFYMDLIDCYYNSRENTETAEETAEC